MKKYLSFLLMLSIMSLGSYEFVAQAIEYVPGKNKDDEAEKLQKVNYTEAMITADKIMSQGGRFATGADINGAKREQSLAAANGANAGANPYTPPTSSNGLVPAQGNKPMPANSGIVPTNNDNAFQAGVMSSQRNSWNNKQNTISTVCATSSIFKGLADSNTDIAAVLGDRDAPSKTPSYIGDGGEGSGQTQSNGQDDMYSLALYAGIMYNIYNTLNPAGDELGRINGKIYSKFLQTITPKTVMSGMPVTFAWVDGAGRVHMVMVMLEDAAPNNRTENAAQDDAPTAMDKSNAATADAHAAKGSAISAEGNFITSQAMIPINKIVAASENEAGNGQTGKGKGEMQNNKQKMDSARQGQDGKKTTMHSTSEGGRNEVFRSQKDSLHSRNVFAMSFQFHMGGPVKGMRGQIDESTAYPPQIAFSRASFRGMGDIEQGQARFEASSGF